MLAESLADERVMLTNDIDFLVLAASHATQGNTFAPVYFLPQQGRPIGEMVRRILREASMEDYRAACSHVHFL